MLIGKINDDCIVMSKLRKMDLKRERSRKDEMWKDSQTLVSQVSAQKQIPRVERTLFIARFGIWSTSRKDAMTLVSYKRCDRRSEFRVRENSFNSGMDHVRALKGQGLNYYEV